MCQMKETIRNSCQYLLWVYRYWRACLKRSRSDRIHPISDKVLVCGNGPSITRVDFDFYKNEGYEFLCTNFFAFSEDLFFKIKPKYYCIVDPAIFSEEYSSQAKRLNEIFAKIDWNMTFITNFENHKLTDNEKIHTIVLNNNLLLSSNDCKKYKYYEKNIASSSYQNVIIAALYYLITATAKGVRLIGVETDFHKELYVGKNNHVYRECVHFYGKEIFDLQEKGEIKEGELYKYFYFYYLTLYQYYDMSKYAKYMGVEVINLCENSFVDVFEKAELKEKIYGE